MKRLAVSLIAAGLCAASHATVVSFDDAIGSSWASLPQGYGGLTWGSSPSNTGWHVWQTASYYPAHSGAFVAYADAGQMDISFASAAVFDGAYFSGNWNSTATFRLFLGNTQVASSSTLAVSGGPLWLASGYSGQVDRVRLVIGGSTQNWVMDDFTFHAPAASPVANLPAVPEPETAALMLAGLGVVGGVATRRRRTTAKA